MIAKGRIGNRRARGKGALEKGKWGKEVEGAQNIEGVLERQTVAKFVVSED